MKLVALLAVCCFAASSAQPGFKSGPKYAAFSATLSPLDGSTVSGQVTVFVTPTGLKGVGSAAGLELNLVAVAAGGSDCTAGNGCGVHVHSGTACTNSTTQGGHYYGGAVDPWADQRYVVSDAAGGASFEFSVTDNATDIVNKPFVVHNNAGGRVACGVLIPASMNASTARLAPLDGGAVSGKVTVYATANAMIGVGHVSGLEASLNSTQLGGANCTAGNGCGVHVHSGTACTNSTTQGGHYFVGATDPWAAEQYQSTSASGAGDFVFTVPNVDSNVIGKPFLVHNNAGGRVSCGILKKKEKRDLLHKPFAAGVTASSGFVLQLWQWLLIAALAVCCLCGAAVFCLKKKPKKRAVKKKAIPAAVPEPVVETPVPPLMPLATTSTMIPSYSMAMPSPMYQQYQQAPMTTSYAAPTTAQYAAPMSAAYAAPMTTGYPAGYAAPMTAQYAPTAAYAAPMSAGYTGFSQPMGTATYNPGYAGSVV